MSARTNDTPLSPGVTAEKVAKRALDDASCEAAFREMLLTWLEAGPDPSESLASCVFCAFLSGAVLVGEAAAMAAVLRSAVRDDDDAFLFFQGHHGRERCVRLNPIARVIQQLTSAQEFTAEDALKAFVGWLGRRGPELFKAMDDNRTAQVAAVQRGARCFWSRYLPKLLLSDANADLTLRPIRPQTLARRATGQPLVRGVPLAPSVFAAAASMLSTVSAAEGSEVMSQVTTIMSQGDGTRLGALRTQQLQLLEPLLDEVDEDAPALILILVAAGICDRGTVRAAHPSHSIAARYIKELAQMFTAAPMLAASLPALGPRRRKEAYAELLQHATDRNDAAAALTNADVYLVDATGCDPAGPIGGGEDPNPVRPARYLSGHERALVIKLCVQVRSTPELEAVVRAVCEIAARRATRPGDLIDCLFEDLEISKDRVVLNRRRRAGLKSTKTATAEGPIEFTEPAVIEALTALKELRKDQAAIDGSPLWGRDLEDSRRLYRRACALIDAMCKFVSGDDFESFYSLRHGVCSDEVLAALELGDVEEAQRALKRASRRADHRDILTTVEYYFRLSADIVQVRTMEAVSEFLTSSIAAVWSGLSPHALDQRVHRSTLPRSETLWRAIGDAAPLSKVKHITTDYPCAPLQSAPATAVLALEDVAYSNVCMGLRFEKGLPIWESGEGEVLASTPWARALVNTRTRYAVNFEDPVRPAATRQPKLRPISRRLRRYGDSAAVRSATALWRSSVKKGFVDVSTPSRLSAWLIFLKECGVPASRLVIRVDPEMVPKVDVINAVFSEITMLVPFIEEVPAGKGRPTAYLLISSKDINAGISPPPASTSMAGFNAVMLAACMREDLARAAAEEDRSGPH